MNNKIRFLDYRSGVNHNDILQFEEKFNILLPTDFKEFLKLSNGGDIPHSTFPININGIEETSDLMGFYSIEHINTTAELLIDANFGNFEKNGHFLKDSDCFISISGTTSAQEILLGVKKKYYGKVYLMYESGFDGELMAFFIANSFTESLEMITYSGMDLK